VAGLGIQKNEYYSAVLPESVIENAGNSAADIKNAVETAQAAIISGLKNLRDSSSSRSEWENSVKDEIANTTDPRSLWRLNVKNLSLYFSNFSATGKGNGFGSVGESRLSTENQNNIRGSATVASEYYSGPRRIDLTLKADYGKAVYPSYTSESADSLIIEGEERRRWKSFNGKLGSLALGPFASAGWETEFTRNKGENLKKILRGKGGLKLFEGNYIKDLSAGITLEQNYTDSSSHNTQIAAETGYRLEFKVPNTGFTVYSDGSYRRFARSRNDTASDLLDRLELNAKVSTSLYRNLSLDIFAKWLYATGKKIPGFGNSLETGFSISYKQLFKLKK